MIKIGDTEYTTLEDLWNDPTMYTEEDKTRINAEVIRMGKRIKARELKKKLIEAKELKKLTHKELTDSSEILFFKVLKLLGYNLDIVPPDETLKKKLTKEKIELTI